MLIYQKNYLYGKQIKSIDNKKLIEQCLDIEKMLLSNLPNIKLGWYGNLITAHHSKYTLLTFPIKELNTLYHEIVKNVSPFLDKEKCYMIKSWMNVFRKGEKVDWHDHWPSEKKVWHGFYCVQVGKSYTEYKIPKVKKIIKVISKEGLLVFGKSDGDKHRSSEWKEENYPRITLAFDIIPVESIESKYQLNHFIPFKI
jgi:hypothetical protein